MATLVPELLVTDPAALRVWLEEHHATSPGARLVLTKKGGSDTTITWASAVEELLCFGWIDGQAGKRDEDSYTVRITPRLPQGQLVSAKRRARGDARGAGPDDRRRARRGRRRARRRAVGRGLRRSGDPPSARRPGRGDRGGAGRASDVRRAHERQPVRADPPRREHETR